MGLNFRRGARSVAETGEMIQCSWHDCEKQGVLLHQVRIEYGANGYSYNVRHLFCCERHRQYFINGHRDYGNLPSGEKGRLL